jgi:regulator of protease activity HflC (stomatin/prohibitin superfamily)
MADISKVLFLRHLRAAPTSYVRHLSNGRVAHDGTGLSFWFRPLVAAISEAPIDDRELPVIFHARTSDFQDVSVQATVVFRIADPQRASTHVDFSLDVNSGRWRSDPLAQLAGLLTETAQQQAIDVLAAMSLAEALTDGVLAVRRQIANGLSVDARLAETGLELIGVRVLALRPEPEVERALQTPTREQIQQQADRATYERRAVAVERERAIAENELQNRIELARREEQLVAQHGTNERRQAEEQAAAAAIKTGSAAQRRRMLAAADADAVRLVGLAEGEADKARIAPWRELHTPIALSLALKELAGRLPEIGTLNLTPDLLSPLLTALAANKHERGEQEAQPQRASEPR